MTTVTMATTEVYRSLFSRFEFATNIISPDYASYPDTTQPPPPPPPAPEPTGYGSYGSYGAYKRAESEVEA